MEQYIPKSVVLAEIKKLIDEIYAGRPFDALSGGQQTALWYIKSIMSSIDTLEVKEVNEVPATVMVNKYGNRFISSWSGLKEYDDLKEGEEIKILIPKK
jgi:hypothetical protein